MRLPLTPQISTKDGVSNKNARLTNVLKEVRKTGELAVVRPGLSISTTYAGLGNGLIVFDGRLLVMVDDTICDPEYVDLLWPLDADEWSADITYAINDVVWYNGDMWFSWEVNFGNAPGSGGWGRWYTFDTWEEEISYDINDIVLVDGVTYYSYINGNIGNNPISSELWKTTPVDTTLTMGAVTYSPATIAGLGFTQTASWTIYSGASPVGSGSGSLVSSYDSGKNIGSLMATNWPRESTSMLGTIATFSARPSTPPEWCFTGSTQWSGNIGWENYAWAPSQSSGNWIALSV